MPLPMPNLRLSLEKLNTDAALQSAVLLVAFAVLLVLALWPELGSIAALIGPASAAVLLALALKTPPGFVMRLYGGQRQEPASLKQIDALVDVLSQRAALMRPPVLYVIPSFSRGAFSLGGPSRSAIAVTEGLLRQLTMREIAAVLAREVSHVGMGDLFVLGLADWVSRASQGLYYVGAGLGALNLWRLVIGEDPVSWITVFLLIGAPLLMNELQLALSRRREFTADRAAALMTGDTTGVASAISRFEASTGSLWDDLVPPVPARKVPLPSLLRFPPPAEARVSRLQALQPPPMPPLDIEEGPRISMVGIGPIAMRPRYRWPGVWF
jgi:heat shock protein HtpX